MESNAFEFGLLSLSMVCVKFLHAVACISSSFLSNILLDSHTAVYPFTS